MLHVNLLFKIREFLLYLIIALQLGLALFFLFHESHTLQRRFGWSSLDTIVVPLKNKWVFFEVVENCLNAIVISVKKSPNPRPN
jgi:hypothetical protein